jgi:hypothetical protein
MPQSLLVKIIFLEAIVAYCYDAYIIINKIPIQPTSSHQNLLTSSFNPVIEGLLILLFVRAFMYVLLIIQSKKDGAGNMLLLIGTIIITAIGIFIESDSKSNGWQFLSIPIQFIGVLILWPIVALTHRSNK